MSGVWESPNLTYENKFMKGFLLRSQKTVYGENYNIELIVNLQWSLNWELKPPNDKSSKYNDSRICNYPLKKDKKLFFYKSKVNKSKIPDVLISSTDQDIILQN